MDDETEKLRQYITHKTDQLEGANDQIRQWVRLLATTSMNSQELQESHTAMLRYLGGQHFEMDIRLYAHELISKMHAELLLELMQNIAQGQLDLVTVQERLLQMLRVEVNLLKKVDETQQLPRGQELSAQAEAERHTQRRQALTDIYAKWSDSPNSR